jgi:predicted TIM-barrel enzyme
VKGQRSEWLPTVCVILATGREGSKILAGNYWEKQAMFPASIAGVKPESSDCRGDGALPIPVPSGVDRRIPANGFSCSRLLQIGASPRFSSHSLNPLPQDPMPNPWTGKGNPYTRTEIIDRLQDTVSKGQAIIAAGAGSGISAKFIEKGGADLIIIYNSGRFRMMGHGSTAGLMAYGDANAIAMEIGEYEVLPIVEEIPVICGVHATDPRRRMWHWLGKVKDMGFSGVNNFPTHTIVDGHFRGVLEETGMSVKKEFEMVALARRMDMFSIVYVGSPEEAVEMAKAGADAIIAHVGTTVGGSIGVTNAVVSWDHTIQQTQAIIDAAKTVRNDIFYLCHGGPINTPEDADRVIQATDCVGFVGASSLERMSVEESLTNLTRQFKSIPLGKKS